MMPTEGTQRRGEGMALRSLTKIQAKKYGTRGDGGD